MRWRDDLSTFVDRTPVESLIDPDVRERGRDPAILGFCDKAGGSGRFGGFGGSPFALAFKR
jgi:hypothetical protein